MGFSGQNEKNILLIVTDLAVANQIMNWLKSSASVKHISKGEEILPTINSRIWDLVITDIKLPTFNDLDVIKLVKLKEPFAPVLIVTEHQKVDFILNALQYHADGLLFKPLHKSKFISLANQLIDDYRARFIAEKNIVLAIGAHPDDVEIGCGGVLARHATKNDEIHILTLSLGEVGGDPSIRKKEAERAAEVQDATLHFAGLTDTRISDGIDTIRHIEKLVQEITPTHVYTHSIHDNHRDHRNIHHATIPACRQVPNLFCYQSPSSTIEFKPSLYVEISGEYLERKIKAIMCFSSQCEHRPYLQEDMIRASARYWGRYSNYGLVEPLEVTRQKVAIT